LINHRPADGSSARSGWLTPHFGEVIPRGSGPSLFLPVSRRPWRIANLAALASLFLETIHIRHKAADVWRWIVEGGKEDPLAASHVETLRFGVFDYVKRLGPHQGAFVLARFEYDVPERYCPFVLTGAKRANPDCADGVVIGGGTLEDFAPDVSKDCFLFIFIHPCLKMPVSLRLGIQ
jgi:hypothetical protein